MTIAQTKLLHEQHAMQARLLVLEQHLPAAPPQHARPIDQGTGAFTLPGGGAPMSVEDLALVEELRRLRPTGSVPAVHSTPSPVTPAPGAGAAGAEEAAEASQTMLQRLTVALELIAGSGEMARVCCCCCCCCCCGVGVRKLHCAGYFQTAARPARHLGFCGGSLECATPECAGVASGPLGIGRWQRSHCGLLMLKVALHQHDQPIEPPVGLRRIAAIAHAQGRAPRRR